MDEFQTHMREYTEIEYALEEAKTIYVAYNDKAATKKREVAELKTKAAELQHQIGKYMIDNGVFEEVFGNVTIAPKKLPDLVHIKDIDRIPAKYIEEKTTVKKVPDKTKAKVAIKNGEAIEGLTLITNRYAIRYKNVKISA